MKGLLVFGIAMSLALSFGAVYADPVTLINPGFDELYTDATMKTPLDLATHGTITVGLGNTTCYDDTPAYVPGWIAPGDWNCLMAVPNTSMIPGGYNNGYVALGLQGWMAQFIPSFTIQPGRYTITAQVAGRADYHPGSLNMRLRAVYPDAWPEISDNSNWSEPYIPWGSFVTWKTEYLVTPDSANIGKQLMAHFTIYSDQVMIDNVAVDYTPGTDETIGDIKTHSDGTPVSFLTNKAITYGPTATNGGFMYIEELNRSAGIKVIIPDSYTNTTSAGDWVSISGTIGTDADTGEKIINLASYTMKTRSPLSPLGTPNKSVVSTTGLLVTTWGKVTAVNDTGEKDSWFYVDDGSGIQDGSGNTGIRCTGNWAFLNAVPNKDEYVSVTGVASTQKIGTQTSTLIRTTQFSVVEN
ncbi:MAG TPA: hypothetical protein VHV83_08710 [Armatimonadota bacterium]|nr:hypothetical protein [Armatimonadota bacterium]